MRKSILDPKAVSGSQSTGNQDRTQDAWLDIEQLASVEITSEDSRFPIENALGEAETQGWRASCKGPQLVRMTFDRPANVRRIFVRFVEPTAHRSQEFSIHVKTGDEEIREVVRQQFTFSPGSSAEETEDYTVGLHAVTMLELRIDPDRAHDPTHSQHFASLQSLQLA